MNYSITNADLSREVRVENYDGTATVTFYPAPGDGEPVVTVVESDEQPPPPEPEEVLEVLQAQVAELQAALDALLGVNP
jgi:hypothetical protein